MTAEPSVAELEEIVAAAVGTIPGIPRTHPHCHGRFAIAALRESGYVIVRAPEAEAASAPVLNVTRDRHCGHCGRDKATASAFEIALCHTDDPGLPDCYRRVTVYHERIGALLGDGLKPAGVEGIIR